MGNFLGGYIAGRVLFSLPVIAIIIAVVLQVAVLHGWDMLRHAHWLVR